MVPNMPTVVVWIKLPVNSLGGTKPVSLLWEMCSVNSEKEIKIKIIKKNPNQTIDMHLSTPPGGSAPLCPVLTNQAS